MTHIVLKNIVKSVPTEQHTAAYRLFFYPVSVMVQQVFTIDAEIAEKFGTPTTGNADLDREFRNAWVSVSITAVQMVEYMEKGATLMFQESQSPTKVYLDLVEHLRAWLQAFDRNPNLHRAPLEDLRKFDELAARIFPYASVQLMPNEDDAGYGAFLARSSRRRGGLASLRRIEAFEAPQLRGSYRPLSDAIAEKLARRISYHGH